MNASQSGELASQLEAQPDVLSAVRDIDSDRRKLVYLYLAVQGGATLDEVKADLELPCLTLLRVLPDLREDGLVADEGGRWVALGA
jgi:predicted transcriptional regulator